MQKRFIPLMVSPLDLDLEGKLIFVFQVDGHHAGQGDLHVVGHAVDGQFCRETSPSVPR